LASTIAAEVRALPADVLQAINDEDSVGLSYRIAELLAFEGFMSYAGQIQAAAGNLAPLTRAQVTCQLYTVFVYLGDACFTRLRKAAPHGSALRKCCKYMTDYPVRGLRNSVAHANWHYSDDFSGIKFHYFEDQAKTQRADYTVTQLELDFWDKLGRVTAYAALQTVIESA